MTRTTLASARIAPVTASTFDALVLDAPGPIVVEFMSYGCSHCRTLEPILQHAAGELASSIRFVHVNVGLDQALANDYAIEATPTLLMFFNGREIDRVEGPQPNLAGIIGTLNRSFGASRSTH